MPTSPQIGDFGLVAGTDPGSELIRLGEWLNGNKFNQYTHACIYTGDNIIIEAMPHGARIATVSEYSADQLTWSSWKLDNDQRGNIRAEAIKLVGTPYSWLDYVALALHCFHIPAPWLRTYIESSKHMICSQLVDYAYGRAGITMFTDNRWPGYVTPADLAEVLTGPQSTT